MKRTLQVAALVVVFVVLSLLRYGAATATDTPQEPALPACTGTTQPPATAATDASGILVTVSIPERPGLNCQ